MSTKEKVMALEAQHKTMSGFSEEIIKSTVPLNVLKIVRIGIANSRRGYEQRQEFNKQCLEIWEGL